MVRGLGNRSHCDRAVKHSEALSLQQEVMRLEGRPRR